MMKVLGVLSFILASTVRSETMCIAHKGYHAFAPENSLESIEAAAALKADGIEFDIHHTQDGIAVLMHDKTLKDTAESKPQEVCPVDKKITKMTFSEIRQKCRLKGSGTDIPTLEEALLGLKDFPNMVFVELKDLPNLRTRNMLQSHFQNQIEKLRVISFNVKNFKPIEEEIDHPFWESVKFQDLALWPFEINHRYGLNMNHKSYHLRKHFLRRLRIEFGVHTVNQVSRMKYFFNEDVDFITTDMLPECLELKKAPKS